MELITALYLLLLFILTLVSLLYYYSAFFGLINKDTDDIKTSGDYLPMVTVQVPVYNDRIVERLLEALVRQDYPNYEIVVADDSTDKVTKEIIDRFSHYPNVKIIRRDSRDGYKAGALNNALKYSKGDIIVVFDSDFVPDRDFLRRMVAPFKDPSISYVQARWTFENLPENLITVFAGTSLLIYHYLIYPLKDRLGTFYLSGSAMAVRRKVLEEVGGWKDGTLAEDADLALRLAAKGYRGKYLPTLHAPNQLPFLINVFLKQQARWASGMIEALLLNWRNLISSKRLSIIQKLSMLLIPLLNLIYVVTAFLVLIGIVLWMLQIRVVDTIYLLMGLLILTSGYLFAGYVALSKSGERRIFPRFVVAAYILGPLVAISNTIAILSYFVKGVPWYVTKKRWVR